jgi:hypothetical protein
MFGIFGMNIVRMDSDGDYYVPSHRPETPDPTLTIDQLDSHINEKMDKIHSDIEELERQKKIVDTKAKREEPVPWIKDIEIIFNAEKFCEDFHIDIDPKEIIRQIANHPFNMAAGNYNVRALYLVDNIVSAEDLVHMDPVDKMIFSGFYVDPDKIIGKVGIFPVKDSTKMVLKVQPTDGTARVKITQSLMDSRMRIGINGMTYKDSIMIMNFKFYDREEL